MVETTNQDWDIDRLKRVLDTASEQENLTLEFKACAALKDTSGSEKREIAKDVSAMANASGGIIVYGVNEKTNAQPFEIVGFDAADVTKLIDRVRDVLNYHVQPKVHFRILQVALGDANGRSVIVVEIPRAELEPHQVDGRYYCRRQTSNLPMSHDEVRESFFRARHPEITLEISLQEINAIYRSSSKVEVICGYSVTIKNVGRVAAKEYRLRLYCPRDVFTLFPPTIEEKYLKSEADCQVLSSSKFVHDPGMVDYVVNATLFPGESLSASQTKELTLECNSICTESRRIREEFSVVGLTPSDDSIKWEIFADNALPKSGTVTLDDLIPLSHIKEQVTFHFRPSFDERRTQLELPANYSPLVLGATQKAVDS